MKGRKEKGRKKDNVTMKNNFILMYENSRSFPNGSGIGLTIHSKETVMAANS